MVRIQPTPIVPPKDDPFRDDLLDRKGFAETLASMFGAIEGPCVFAIDGGWGTGKTTFVDMFTQHLRNENHRVIKLNAWETDFTDNPLAALLHALKEHEDGGAWGGDVKEAALKVLQATAPTAIRLLTAGVLNLDSKETQDIGNALAGWATDGIKQYEEHQQSLQEFKNSLRKMAPSPSEASEIPEAPQRPLVFVIDELDRCRPTYAVAMLETIKHVFSVDGVIFLLALNRSQLDRSAQTLYGEFGDAESYFARFFDVEVALPNSKSLSDVLGVLLDRAGCGDGGVPTEILQHVVGAAPWGIRAIERLALHHSLSSAALSKLQDSTLWWVFLPTLSLLKMIDDGLHRDLLDGIVSGRDAVSYLLERHPWLAKVRDDPMSAMSWAWFQAGVVLVSGDGSPVETLQILESTPRKDGGTSVMPEEIRVHIFQAIESLGGSRVRGRVGTKGRTIHRVQEVLNFFPVPIDP